ncbi:MAG: 1-acyl-sn-glycerol-3-phosphate acyltransferase [Myxococcota bacterium]
MRREDQERILTEIRCRLVEERLVESAGGGMPLEETIAGSIYHESRRLKEEPPSRARREDQLFWDEVRRRLRRAGERELIDLLDSIVARYAEEIRGNFDPRVYELATRMLPPALGVLLNAVTPIRLLSGPGGIPGLDDTVLIQGEVDHLRRLHDAGTVILCPTHSSNLDSPLLGLAVYRMGLPPVIYGAGLNLFSNPLISFFMHNLGAYTVDRRKKDPLYKEVLKTYAALTLEHGYDNLFFPGGTRSRSGAIERRLKLGLLGCGLTAYIQNLRRGAPRPKIFIVPATLSYGLTLEAETLIDDFLKDVGKSRYIITDDEFSRPTRVFDFVRRLFALDSKIYFTVGRGLDPFGNPVDDDGESLDPRGRRIVPSRYVLVDGEPRLLAQRDAEYTRELGARIADSFKANNVLQSTHVTAGAVFGLLRRANPEIDLVRLIRVGGRKDSFDLREVHRETGRLLDELAGLAARGGIRLAPSILHKEPEEVVADGLAHFATYHRSPAAYRKGDRVFPGNHALLFYYRNRLEGYRLERNANMPPVLDSEHLSLRAA